MSIIDKVRDLGVDTNSFIAAVRDLGTKFSDCSKGELDYQIASLTNKHIETRHVMHAKILFGYIVQESVRAHMTKTEMSTDELVLIACDKTTTFFVQNPWNDIATEQVVVTTADGSTTTLSAPKKKRGNGPSKRDLSVELYNKVKDQNLTRAKLIELFVSELGLTPAGASTYVANCRSGLWK